MTDRATETPQPGPAVLAASLLATLQEEYEALSRLRRHFDEHIRALRQREKEGIDEATHRTNDEINLLAKLKHQRDRKIRLLGRVLRIEPPNASIEAVVEHLERTPAAAGTAADIRTLRRNIREEARKTRKRCHDLEFALEYAVLLGQDLLKALQGMAPAGSTKVYTPKGGAVESTGAPAFVNKVG